MDEYISKQRAKDLMGCCLASAKAEYKAAKGGLKKARYGDYISAIQSMIDVVGKVEAADVQPVKRGKWVEDDIHIKCCSVCHTEAYWETDYGQQLFDFCPYCGADMRDVSDTDVGEIANVVEFKKRLTDRQTAEALKSNAEGLLSKGMQVDIADLRYIKLAEYENKEENNVETTGS